MPTNAQFDDVYRCRHIEDFFPRTDMDRNEYPPLPKMGCLWPSGLGLTGKRGADSDLLFR